MFSLSGFIKTLGVVLVFYLSISFIFGLFQIQNMAITLVILYVLCYVLNGILAPIWNPKTPYIASYLSSITLTLINMLFAYYVLDVLVFADPEVINNGFVRNSFVSLMMTFFAVKIYSRKQRVAK
ncbi:hypothetical protein ACFSO7_00920 [Bacillus sp. CGMCC 1.16607]|uniref:hypothetical protein n=1 Tax=Bacillus sp. CGMCC 1.16607 TaxID=3351842 RepID=UPI00362B692A